MSRIFFIILNMSITASYVILFVIFVRMLLKKAPKIMSYILWSVVGLRLIVPATFKSMLSLLPRSAGRAVVPFNHVNQESHWVSGGFTMIDPIQKGALPEKMLGASPGDLLGYSEIGAYVWIAGMVALLLYSVASVLLLKRALKDSKRIDGNIYEAERLKTPFVLGVIKPKIYLPVGLNEMERNHVLLHEQIHIRRRDPIIKLVAFFILSIHWFNPFVWIAFKLMNLDMELSCDEKVLKELKENIKKPYANSLLVLATEKSGFQNSSLAFGEGNITERIKNILRYKKPKSWIVFMSIALVLVVGVGLLLNPETPKLEKEKNIGKKASEKVETKLVIPKEIKPITPNVSLKQELGVGMPELDYASDRIVIFHSFFGLFVYDIEKREIIRGVDLKVLNCDQIQGSNYCDVSVSTDGETVNLHPMESKSMYVYSVSNHTLKEAPFEKMEQRYQGVGIEEALHTKELGQYSYNAAKFDSGEYGYLFAPDWTVGELTYVRGDMMFLIFDTKD